jgi:hypothetical protein
LHPKRHNQVLLLWPLWSIWMSYFAHFWPTYFQCPRGSWRDAGKLWVLRWIIIFCISKYGHPIDEIPRSQARPDHQFCCLHDNDFVHLVKFNLSQTSTSESSWPIQMATPRMGRNPPFSDISAQSNLVVERGARWWCSTAECTPRTAAWVVCLTLITSTPRR